MAKDDSSRHAAPYADLGEVPPHHVGELLGGERVISPRPGPLQARAVSQLLKVLVSWVKGHEPEAWVILKEVELHLSGDVLVPDLVAWRRERVLGAGDAPISSLAPDWVCEVISPATEALDRGCKMLCYAREQVANVWVLSPDSRALEVYRFEDEAWSLIDVHEGSATVKAEPFEALALELGPLWEL